MTMQAMNGDYDGDKIYAAILSRFDLFGNNKSLQLNEIAKEIKRDNNLLNAIRKDIDIFEEIKKYEMKNKNGNKLLQETFDDIIYGSKFKTSSVETQRKYLKNTLFPIIKTYDNALSMWEDKLIDELGDAKKTVHMNTYYKFYSDSLGKEVNVKNSFWYNLYKHSDSISKNKLGNMTIEESLKTLYSIKSSNLFSKLSKVEQELVDNLISNPEKLNEVFKEILEKDNKNLKIMFSDFGTPTYLRAYLDNIKTGIANVELTEQSKFVRKLVLDDGLENQIDFITKKSNIKDSSKDWWLKDFRSFYDKDGKLKQDEVDNFRTLIKVLTGDDLYGELQEKAISSKHGQDSAEALIEYHKSLVDSVGMTTINIKELNVLKSTFANIYSARTEEDLKKINFINDYFRVFTSKGQLYGSDDILINNAKKSVKNLLKLMGTFSNEILDDVDNVSSIDDFNLDRVSKWFGVKIENGIIEQKSYKKMQRYFSHLNGVVITDIFDKFSKDKDDSKSFSKIFNKFKREKNLLEFLSETTSVLSEKAISAFNFVFGKNHKIKDIEISEQEENIEEIFNNNENSIEEVIKQETKTNENKIKNDITNSSNQEKDSNFILDIQNETNSKTESEINSKQLQEIINEKKQVIENKNNISDVVENELKNNSINYSEKEINNQSEINTSEKLIKEENESIKQLKLFEDYSEENEIKNVIDNDVKQKQNIASTINEIKKDEVEEVLNKKIEDVSTTKQNFSVQETVQEINEKQIENNIEKTSINVTKGMNLNDEIEEVQENVSNINLSDINKNTQQIKEEVIEAVKKSSDEISETKKIDAIGEIVDKTKNTATKIQKKVKSFSEKHQVGVVAGGALITLGLFFNLINRNRTVVHLEMNDQINQQEQGLNSRNNIQRRMGQYLINTNIRDTF